MSAIDIDRVEQLENKRKLIDNINRKLIEEAHIGES